MDQAATDRPNKLMAGEAAAKCAQRERTWDECGLEEKVERLRLEAQDRRSFIDAGYALARKAWQLVRSHQHANDGRVLVDAEASSENASGMLAGRGHDRLR